MVVEVWDEMEEWIYVLKPIPPYQLHFAGKKEMLLHSEKKEPWEKES